MRIEAEHEGYDEGVTDSHETRLAEAVELLRGLVADLAAVHDEPFKSKAWRETNAFLAAQEKP